MAIFKKNNSTTPEVKEIKETKVNKKLLTDMDITAALIEEYKAKNLPLEDLFYRDGIKHIQRDQFVRNRPIPTESNTSSNIERKVEVIKVDQDELKKRISELDNEPKQKENKKTFLKNNKKQKEVEASKIVDSNIEQKTFVGNNKQEFKSAPITEQNSNNKLDADVIVNQEQQVNENNNLVIVENITLKNKIKPVIDPKAEPVKTYIRLADQSKDDLISLNQGFTKPTPGICSYDPNANYAVEMIDIYKTFNNGKIHANNGITIRVKHNEVHTIIGENGAGKSVLMSILFGIYDADSGEIKINGKPVVFSSAKDATYAGLGMVHQHFKLIENDTVYKNIILGCETVGFAGSIRHAEAKSRLLSIIEKYNLGIDINKKISKLSVAEQQKVEILKLLYRNADILIFDEPTAILSNDEIIKFLEIVKQLKNEGKTIILITHKFNEIKEVADRASVIRLGTFISDFDVKSKSIDEMAKEMVGHEIEYTGNENVGQYSDDVILEVNNLVISNQSKDNPISFKVRAGEIFAIAGVVGNGQSELALMLAGLEKPKSGEIILNDKKLKHIGIRQRYKNGMSFVPEDRHKHALILDAPIYINTVLNSIDSKEYSTHGIIHDTNIKEHARLFIKKYDVRGTTRGLTPSRVLSGGNQQKLVVGREIENEHNLLILVQPTRGLDLSAISKIHKLILEEKAKNKAIILISYELDEIVSLADTIAVMSKGSFVKIDSARSINKELIGNLMTGKEA